MDTIEAQWCAKPCDSPSPKKNSPKAVVIGKESFGFLSVGCSSSYHSSVGIIGMAVGGEIVGMFCLPCCFLSSRFHSSGLEEGFSKAPSKPWSCQSPLEDVHTIHWFDPAHRYLCAIKHITIKKRGGILSRVVGRSLSQIIGRHFRDSLNDPPSESAMTQVLKPSFLWDPHKR